MIHVTVLPPRRDRHAVEFRWRVEPESPLYRNCRFTLAFPEDLDLTPVPDAAWSFAALLCLHSHWALLRPCRVTLPVGLPAEMINCLGRLLATYATTLDTYRGEVVPGTVEIEAAGPPLTPRAAPDTGRCATAFSSGKDSLLQAGLLRELSASPILVTTTSPMPGLFEHETQRRRRILREVAGRPEWRHVEVHSDYRSCWDNDYARRLGYPVSVNELSDTFLYTAALLLAGLAQGATHLFLASETEVSENVAVDGRVVQHPHFMYSAVTQAAWNALLRPLGVRYGSLTSALHSRQVQQLLWRRYPDLRHLQYSCWRVRPEEAACSRCAQCLRLACSVLEIGDRPGRMGIDLAQLLHAQANWTPREPVSQPLPQEIVGRMLMEQTAQALRSASIWRVLAALLRDQPSSLLRRSGWRALRNYARLRRRALALPPSRQGYRPGFLGLVDPLLRGRLAQLYAEQFPAEEPALYADSLARIVALSAWTTAPLASSREAA